MSGLWVQTGNSSSMRGAARKACELQRCRSCILLFSQMPPVVALVTGKPGLLK